MKLSAGQAGKICLEAAHQLGRIALLLFMLVLGGLGLFAYSLSRHPLELPQLTSWLATNASGDGISVRMQHAELAWAGYHEGGAVPLVLRLKDVSVRSAAGALLVEIPQADAVVPPADLFGGRIAVLLLANAAQISGSEAPVTIRANIWPGPGFTLARGTFFVSIGAGRLGIRGASVPVSSASFTMRTSPGVIDVTNGTATLAPVGASAPHAGFSFTARRDTGWAASLHATVDAVRAEDLGQYWPEKTLTITRDWVVTHITTGEGRNADFTFSLAAPGDLSGLRLTDATGGFDGTGLTLYWLQDGIPITGLDGRYAMPDMDEVVITSSAGQEGRVRIREGRMDITGVSHKDQTGVLKLDLAGQVPDVLAVLDAPPLRLLHGAPPEIANITGQTEGKLSITIPFKKDLTFDDLTLAVSASAQNVAMPSVLPPLGASKGQVELQTDGRVLHLRAKAEFAGEPASLVLNESLGTTGKTDLTLTGAAGPQLWHWMGIDNSTALNGPAAGTAPFTIHITGSATGAQTVALQADLTNAALALPAFGWSKTQGQAGSFAATAVLRNGVFLAAQNFSAQAPGLNVAGVQQGNALVFSAANIGRTRATGTLGWPAAPGGNWSANFSGPVLDIREPKQNPAGQNNAPTQSAPAAPPSGPAWSARLKFTQLYLAAAPAPAFNDFSVTAQGHGTTVQQAEGSAAGLTLSITPQSATRIALVLRSTDTGTLLRGVDAYQHLQGGTLALKALYGGGQPVTGNAKLLEARFVDAPDVTKVLEGLTLYGLADAASGPGLKISRAEIPFTLQNDVLTLNEARAYSSSLGFTASGSFDVANNNCDLHTTIVPLYDLNALPGKIPLIGKLFSAEKGGGLLAMRAHISGPIDHADVSVNPLSALAPGFLRGIFGLGEAPKPNPAEEPKTQ
jgi:hypothetical protein